MARTLLFSGHRIDDPQRPNPRFPTARVAAVAAWIDGRVAAGDVCFSSLANGGDILFAEACRVAGARHHILLPFTLDRFEETSVVTAAPGDWIRRFRSLWATTPPDLRHVLDDPGKDAYAACNRALLSLVLEQPAPRHLLAVWDGAPGRPGGTGSMVALARAAGLAIDLCDPRPA